MKQTQQQRENMLYYYNQAYLQAIHDSIIILQKQEKFYKELIKERFKK